MNEITVTLSFSNTLTIYKKKGQIFSKKIKIFQNFKKFQKFHKISKFSIFFLKISKIFKNLV
jgi:hypothetical protein